MSDVYREVKGDPYHVQGRQRQARNTAFVGRYTEGYIDVGLAFGTGRQAQSVALRPAQAVAYACAIIRVAEPDTADVLCRMIGGWLSDWPTEEDEDRSYVTKLQGLAKLLS